MFPARGSTRAGSSAGAAIDHLLTLHPAAPAATATAASEGGSLPGWLAAAAGEGAATLSAAVRRAGGLHVVPEFLGNRAPFADPRARAVIAGLGMSTGVDSLIGLSVAGLCGIGYGLRQIIETQAAHGASIGRVMVSGGAGQLDLVRQLLADSTGKPVVAAGSDEPVLLGSAMLGAVAGGLFRSVPDAMAAMSASGQIFYPASEFVDLHTLRSNRFGVFSSWYA